MEYFRNAQWIWSNDSFGVNIYADFFDKITIPELSGNFLLRISCDTNYALYINDIFAECGQYSDYENLKFFDEFDISNFIISGENEIKITVYHQGDNCSTYRVGKPGVIFELFCGDRSVLASSCKTLAHKNTAFTDGDSVEHVSGQLGYSFRYDSRNINPQKPLPCVTVYKTYSILPRPIDKLSISLPISALLGVHGGFSCSGGNTIGQRMQYSSLKFAESNSDITLPSHDGVRLEGYGDGTFAVIDLGREHTGLLDFDIEVPCDCEILIGWGEHLDDLRVRAYVGGRNFCASYYAKAGRNRFFHPFRRLGLRYLQINAYIPSFTLYHCSIRETLYPLSNDITFTCADTLHTTISEVCKRTLHLCMHDHYEDCPWREQALYSMDSRNQMLCGYYAFREIKFARASLKLMAHSIRDDNLLELCSPAVVAITIPSFSAIFLTQLYEYLEYSKDTEFAHELIPVACRIADEFIRRTDNNKQLIKCFIESKYWNFYEWQDGLEGSITSTVADVDATYDAPLNAFVSFGLRSLADIFRILGNTEKETFYRSEHFKLNSALDKEFYDEKRGVYASYSRGGEIFHYAELTNSLIIYADICSGDKLDRVLSHLTDKSLIEVTLSHSIFKYDALMRSPDKYGRFMFKDIARLWGHMISKDATTFWETIDGEAAFGNAGSLCHGWSAIPLYFYHKYAATLDSSITGLYEVVIK